MANTIFKYPLDLSGTNPDNKVIGEAHTIGVRKGRVFCADYGPFFGDSIVLVDGVTGRELIPMEDYRLVHYYKEAADRTGQGVYSAIQIHNLNVSTTILMTAQMVGGEFSYSTYAILQALEALQNDERPIQWGELIDVPAQFVPAPHLHDVYDLYGMKALVEVNADVAAALREGDVASRNLLLKQINDRFVAFDKFCMQLANCFESGAAELAAIQ